MPALSLMLLFLFTKMVNGGGAARPHDNSKPSYPIAPAELSFKRNPSSIGPLIPAVATAAVAEALLLGVRSPVRDAVPAPDPLMRGSFECNMP